MKRLITLFLVLLFATLVLTCCANKKKEPTQKSAQTDTLNLELGDDGCWIIDSVTSHALSDITIPESYNDIPITTIKKDAFSGCSNITSIRIPKSITYVGSTAFENCSQLSEIYISNKDAVIASNAFNGCPIKSAQLPSSQIDILPTEALEKIYLLDGTVQDDAFSGFFSLHTIAVVGDVTFTEGSLLSCPASTFMLPPSKLESFTQKHRVHNLIVSPSLVESPSMIIGLKAFEGYSALHNITFEPYSQEYVFMQGAFEGCLATSFAIHGSLMQILPTTTETLTVLGGEIPYLGTTRNLNLKMLIIRPEVTKIQESAFRECTSLNSVSILASVDTIGAYTFYKCSALETVEIGASIKTIRGSAFASCTSLKRLELGSGVSKIEKNAFNGCAGLTVLNLKAGVQSVGERAFEGCTSLTTINIGPRLTNLDLSAFYGCSSIESINIDEGNTTFVFQGGAFLTADKKTLIKYADTKNELYVIPSSVEVINAHAFLGNKSLVGIGFNDSIKLIGKEAFKDCIALTAITLGNGIEMIDESSFSGCVNLNSIALPKNVKQIGKNAFYGCKSLSSVILNESLVEIRQTAFYNCDSLVEIVIPESVTMIGERAFASCDSLEKIYIAHLTHADSFNERWINGCDAQVYTIDDKE